MEQQQRIETQRERRAIYSDKGFAEQTPYTK